MVVVKLVKIDGESIHIFNSVIYIFESSYGQTLELDLIVSEVVRKRYMHEKSLIVEAEMEDGRTLNAIMNVKILQGRLPQMNLYMEIDDNDDYQDYLRVNDESMFPNIEAGITIEEIRKVEMPNQKVTLKLTLPIDQAEWLNSHKQKDLNKLFQEMIYQYWRR